MNDIIPTIKKEVKDEKARKRIYKGMIEAFENEDWDTQNESEGIDTAFDAALAELHPDWAEEEDEE